MNVASGIDTLTRFSRVAESQRILIVDDEPRYLSAYRELLAGAGRIIEECGTGKEAILRLDRRDIDVVVLDLQLPDIAGTATIAWLPRNGK